LIGWSKYYKAHAEAAKTWTSDDWSKYIEGYSSVLSEPLTEANWTSKYKFTT
jgi:hypothetical protein